MRSVAARRAKLYGAERQKFRHRVCGGSMTSNHDDMLTSRHRFSTLEIIHHELLHSMMISQKVTGEPSCIRVFLVVEIVTVP